MNEPQILSAQVTCTLSELVICNGADEPIDSLNGKEPFKLQLSLTFGDTAQGNLIQLLLPLGLHIRISFLANPADPTAEVDLGEATFITEAEKLIYEASLLVEPNGKLSADKVYKLGALVRVGNAPFCIPSLMRGYAEFLIQMSDRSAASTPSPKAPVAVASAPVEPSPAVEPAPVAEPTPAAEPAPSTIESGGEEDEEIDEADLEGVDFSEQTDDPEVIITKLKIARRKSPKSE